MSHAKSTGIGRLFADHGRKRLLYAAAFVIIILPTVLVAVIGCVSIRRELTARALDRRAVIAELAGRSAQARFDAVIDLGRSLASRVAFSEHVAAGRWNEAVAILQRVPADFPQVERLFLTDVSGTEMADFPHLPGVIGKNFSDRDWYKGVSREWTPYVSEVYLRAAEPRIHVVAVAVPIRTPDVAEVAGILVMQIRLDTLLGWVHEIRADHAGELYLTDRNGRLMAHPSLVFEDGLIDFSEVPSVRRALSGGTGVGIAYNPVLKEERIHATWISPSYGFVAIASEPTASAFASRDRQMRFLYAVFAIIVLLNAAAAAALVRALREMAAMTRKEQAYLSSVGDGVIAIDRAWNITLWNPAAEKLTGWQAAETLGRPFRERVKFIREQDRRENIAFIEEAMLYGEGRALRNSTLLLTRDGRELPIGDSAAPIFGDDGAVTGVIIVFRDMSREKEANLLRSDFAYASHQFRTPINTALWNLELALEQAKIPEVRQAVENAYRGLLDTRAIAERLLELSQIDQRTITPNFSSVALKSVLGDAVAHAKREIDARGTRLLLPDLPDGSAIDTDAKLLSRAIGELLRNAALYGPAGGETRVGVKSDRLETLIEVADSGPGIPADQQALVFTKFFRGSNVKDDAAGAGLGLFIAREYVRLLGGKLWFQSIEGKGSTFLIKLPNVRGVKL